ncbi:hypothetical protein HispidOSU_020354, partial [Sigmodon hispidus]
MQRQTTSTMYQQYSHVYTGYQRVTVKQAGRERRASLDRSTVHTTPSKRNLETGKEVTEAKRAILWDKGET